MDETTTKKVMPDGPCPRSAKSLQAEGFFGKWEYKVVSMRGLFPDSHQDVLDTNGADGWELVNVWDAIAYLKRPKP